MKRQDIRDSASTLSRLLGSLTLLGFAVAGVLLVAGLRSAVAPVLVAALSLAAVYAWRHPVLRRFAFTVWVLAFVAASLSYPAAFGTWFEFDLKHLIQPLIQIIMFGMGTTLALRDFARVASMPWPVFIGMALQFSVMPLAGYAIAKGFGFPPEIAAGVVLIGSCSGGVASNLMTYLAGGNVALSVTMTACSTLMAPLLTPFLMSHLAGEFIAIDFVDMMVGIINIVVVPVLAGLVAHRVLYGKGRFSEGPRCLVATAVVCGALAVMLGIVPMGFLGSLAALRTGAILALVLVGVVALAKWIIRFVLSGPENWMDRTLPWVSMFGICFIIAIITARSSEDLLRVGVALIAAAVLHNAVGYTAGYWAGRVARLDESTCRTIAFEVGMQNGGMASALAMNVLHSASAALAPAIFGPWMNVSGSVLATWWRGRPVAARHEGGDNGSA